MAREAIERSLSCSCRKRFARANSPGEIILSSARLFEAAASRSASQTCASCSVSVGASGGAPHEKVANILSARGCQASQIETRLKTPAIITAGRGLQMRVGNISYDIVPDKVRSLERTCVYRQSKFC